MSTSVRSAPASRCRVNRSRTACSNSRCRGAHRLLNDRRGSSDLRLLVIRLGGLLLLAIGRRDLSWRHGGGVGLNWGLAGRTAFELQDAIFELAVAILQLFVLAGELAQLVFQPLDPHLRVVVRLRENGRAKREQRGERHDAFNDLKSG